MKKPNSIHNMFASIASSYDVANSVLTFGLDSYWRKKLIRLSEVSPDAHVLDCATGTGKLAFEFLNSLNSKGRVVGIDFCQEMLDQIKDHPAQIQFQKADVLSLPFADQTFNITSIAYGLRNLSDYKKGLAEMARVTKSKSYVMVLETGKPSASIIAPFLSLYMRVIIPILGGLISGNTSAYKYLHKSSLNFPSREKLIQIFQDTDCYNQVECFPLFFGASYIYRAQVK